MRFLRDNALSIFFLVLCVATIFGQSIAGHNVFNEDAAEHGSATVSYWRYLLSSHFGQGLMENWQSEFLQFSMFIAATIWLVQKGSAESKKPGDAGLGSDQEQLVGKHAQRNSPRWAKVGGIRTWIFANSLLFVMTAIFFATLAVQSVTGWNEYNNDQREHDEAAISWATYVTTSDFWEDALQNWQSEFLAVGTMAVFTIYLRQRGSPESKLVGAPHDATEDNP